jgi:8-oxo-dGTP diphosphatase
VIRLSTPAAWHVPARKVARGDRGRGRVSVAFVCQDEPPSHWVALVLRVRVDPPGEPHKVDAPGWFRPDELPSPVHSQLLATPAV